MQGEIKLAKEQRGLTFGRLVCRTKPLLSRRVDNVYYYVIFLVLVYVIPPNLPSYSSGLEVVT